MNTENPNVDKADPGNFGWPCQAYGKAGLRLGIVCFFSAYENHRVCGSRLSCEREMGNERRRLWGLIATKAFEGDELATRLLASGVTIDELLNGEIDEGDGDQGDEHTGGAKLWLRASGKPNPAG